jgi:hypothetical protein
MDKNKFKYTCSTCGLGTNDKTAHTKHINKKKPCEGKLHKATVNTNANTCDICKHTFATKTTYDNHMDKKHPYIKKKPRIKQTASGNHNILGNNNEQYVNSTNNNNVYNITIFEQHAEVPKYDYKNVNIHMLSTYEKYLSLIVSTGPYTGLLTLLNFNPNIPGGLNIKCESIKDGIINVFEKDKFKDLPARDVLREIVSSRTRPFKNIFNMFRPFLSIRTRRDLEYIYDEQTLKSFSNTHTKSDTKNKLMAEIHTHIHENNSVTEIPIEHCMRSIPNDRSTIWKHITKHLSWGTIDACIDIIDENDIGHDGNMKYTLAELKKIREKMCDDLYERDKNTLNRVIAHLEYAIENQYKNSSSSELEMKKTKATAGKNLKRNITVNLDSSEDSDDIANDSGEYSISDKPKKSKKKVVPEPKPVPKKLKKKVVFVSTSTSTSASDSSHDSTSNESEYAFTDPNEKSIKKYDMKYYRENRQYTTAELKKMHLKYNKMNKANHIGPGFPKWTKLQSANYEYLRRTKK